MEQLFSIGLVIAGAGPFLGFGYDLYSRLLFGREAFTSVSSGLALWFYMSTLGFCFGGLFVSAGLVPYVRRLFNRANVFVQTSTGWRCRLAPSPMMRCAYFVFVLLLPPLGMLAIDYPRAGLDLKAAPLPFHLHSVCGAALAAALIAAAMVVPLSFSSYTLRIAYATGEISVHKRFLWKRRWISFGRFIGLEVEAETTMEISRFTGVDSKSSWLMACGTEGDAPCASSSVGFSPAIPTILMRRLLPTWEASIRQRIMVPLKRQT